MQSTTPRLRAIAHRHVTGTSQRTLSVRTEYSTVVNIAPQFLDFTLTTVPVTTEEIKEKTGQRFDELTKPQSGAKKPAPTEKK